MAGFFLEEDLQPGIKMNLDYFIKIEATFSPPHDPSSSSSSEWEHGRISFSSTELPNILKHFSMKPESVEAQIINNTINECEAPVMKGEEKHCATSLESMIDFTISKMGKKVDAFSTEVEVEKEETQKQKQQEYTINGIGLTKLGGDKYVVCHKREVSLCCVLLSHNLDSYKGLYGSTGGW